MLGAAATPVAQGKPKAMSSQERVFASPLLRLATERKFWFKLSANKINISNEVVRKGTLSFEIMADRHHCSDRAAPRLTDAAERAKLAALSPSDLKWMRHCFSMVWPDVDIGKRAKSDVKAGSAVLLFRRPRDKALASIGAPTTHAPATDSNVVYRWFLRSAVSLTKALESGNKIQTDVSNVAIETALSMSLHEMFLLEQQFWQLIATSPTSLLFGTGNADHPRASAFLDVQPGATWPFWDHAVEAKISSSGVKTQPKLAAPVTPPAAAATPAVETKQPATGGVVFVNDFEEVPETKQSATGGAIFLDDFEEVIESGHVERKTVLWMPSVISFQLRVSETDGDAVHIRRNFRAAEGVEGTIETKNGIEWPKTHRGRLLGDTSDDSLEESQYTYIHHATIRGVQTVVDVVVDVYKEYFRVQIKIDSDLMRAERFSLKDLLEDHGMFEELMDFVGAIIQWDITVPKPKTP